MATHVTKRGNLCEILYTNAELRVFTPEKEARVFQCGLIINDDNVRVRLGANFEKAGLAAFWDVEQGLLAEGFSTVTFEREHGGKTKTHTLKQRD